MPHKVGPQPSRPRTAAAVTTAAIAASTGPGSKQDRIAQAQAPALVAKRTELAASRELAATGLLRKPGRALEPAVLVEFLTAHLEVWPAPDGAIYPALSLCHDPANGVSYFAAGSWYYLRMAGQTDPVTVAGLVPDVFGCDGRPYAPLDLLASKHAAAIAARFRLRPGCPAYVATALLRQQGTAGTISRPFSREAVPADALGAGKPIDTLYRIFARAGQPGPENWPAWLVVNDGHLATLGDPARLWPAQGGDKSLPALTDGATVTFRAMALPAGELDNPAVLATVRP